MNGARDSIGRPCLLAFGVGGPSAPTRMAVAWAAPASRTGGLAWATLGGCGCPPTCLPAPAVLAACLCLVLAWAAAYVGRLALAWATCLCVGGC
eukprot:6965550-Alexandrium_andersonii.AAC.1